MLMGAIANMAPALFGGIIAEVPFVDVLTTMLDDTLPLTPPEWPEWGNPIASRRGLRTIAAYSPYDNVGATELPAYPCGRRLDRSARDLLGAGEMGCAIARSHDRITPCSVQDQHGFRTCRRFRPVFTAGRNRLQLRLCAESCRQGRRPLWACNRAIAPERAAPPDSRSDVAEPPSDKRRSLAGQHLQAAPDFSPPMPSSRRRSRIPASCRP